MVLLVCMLKDYRAAEALLLLLVELGVPGATVLEGRGIGQILGREMPQFAAMRGLFPGSVSDTQVVLSAMPAALAEACLTRIEAQLGPLDRPGSGFLFTVPLGDVRGVKPPFA